MSLETSNSRNLLGVRGPDGVLEALPFRSCIYRPDWRQKMVDNPPREEQIFRVDWHTLNLKRPEISETLSTMPSDARDCGAAVSCRNRVYVLGGRCSESSSYVVPAGNPAAVATGTKIYVFGSVSATAGHFAEVFDTEGICWETVPPPPAAPGLVPSSASDPVLLDSPRSRILVHFHSNGSLHAFYPDDGSWECLEPEFGRWSPASAMVDDVVYFLYTSGWDCWYQSDSRDFLGAYHVVYKKWMPIKWKTESPLPISSIINLFHLGNGVMCVAYYSELELFFMYKKFRVHFDSYSGEINATVESESATIVPFECFSSELSIRGLFLRCVCFVPIAVQGLPGMVRQEAANKVHGNVCLESVVGTQSLDRKLHAFDVLFEYGGAKWNCYRTIAVLRLKLLMVLVQKCWMVQVHGNVCPESVVVTQTLDRKLHAFDVLSEYDGTNGTATGPFLGNACVDAKQLPRQIVSKKIFPLLTSALEYGSAAARALNALLKIALANIQAAQKRPMSQPVSQPKPQATSLRPKSTVKVAKVEDDDLWSSIAAPPPPKVPSNPSKIKTSGAVEDDDPWAAIAAPTPTTKAKPLSAGRGGGTKPALKLRDH
ncbi:hypothetical protein V6N13_092218 [Hibiscus sabdariffa]